MTLTLYNNKFEKQRSEEEGGRRGGSQLEFDDVSEPGLRLALNFLSVVILSVMFFIIVCKVNGCPIIPRA
jgi:hypothetical protein